MGDPVFVLDANVFIQAHRHYYPFDLAPRFWSSLVQHAENGRLESIDRVKAELERGRDELASWANEQFGGAFASTDEEVTVKCYTDIMNWVNGQIQFFDAAKASFAGGADGWLVAYAKAKGRVVVTHEVLNPDIKRRVPIPNVCQAFKVVYVNTFKMMRELGVQWS